MTDWLVGLPGLPVQDRTSIRDAIGRLAGKGLLRRSLTLPPGLLEPLARQASTTPYFRQLATSIQQRLPVPPAEESTAISLAWRRSVRDLRIGLLANDESGYNQTLLRLLELQERFPNRFPQNPLVRICNAPFTAGWFAGLPLHVRFYALYQIFADALRRLEDADAPLAYLRDRNTLASLPSDDRDPFSYLLISQLLLRGQLDEAWKALGNSRHQRGPLGLRGWCCFLAGRAEEAMAAFEEELAAIRQDNQDKHAYFTGPEGIFSLLALLEEGGYHHHPAIRTIVADLEALQPKNPLLPAYHLLLALVDARENRLDLAQERLKAASRIPAPHSITLLLHGLVSLWIGGTPPPHLLPRLRHLQDKAQRHGYHWLAREYAALLATSGDTPPPATEEAMARLHPPLAAMLVPEKQWQRALRALNFHPATTAAPAHQRLRIAWLINYNGPDNPVSLSPRVQFRTTHGGWSRGRAIALGKLKRPDILPFLSPQDLLACAAIQERREGRRISYWLDAPQAIQALVGHPAVFLAPSPGTPVEVATGQPELILKQDGEMLELRIHPWPDKTAIRLLLESPGRLVAYPITDQHRRVAMVIGQDGLRLPLDQRDELFATLGDLSSFLTVQSSVEGSPTGCEEVRSDSRIHLRLQPYASGFRAAMLVRPLGPDGPLFKPGEGPLTLLATVGGKRLQTRRNLAVEEAAARRIEAVCPALPADPAGEREWLLPEPEECLQLLTELQAMPEEVVVEWPEGERLTVSPPAELNQFILTARERNNWFELHGSLHLDESLVLDMRRLLELSQTTQSRFIPLGQGHFLTLSKELRRRLDEMAAFAELRKHTVRLHPLALPALEELTDGLGGFEADEAWRRQLERLRRSEESPPVPVPLAPVLRDYQATGFQWLARLAAWGGGACLADDMGLGKTVQTLALILHRASGGPTLVVAPTSVCANWQEEAQRFAPGLTVIIFGGRQRQQQLERLGPFDLVICSYGLLQQEADLLATLEWQTIVLDEAQAIKNFITKRSRAAMRLAGRFRMVTTGTPVENHLSELWNLFQFINPGLLGTLAQFTQRFAIPIERDGDPVALSRLKRLIGPFILRRLKSQVLSELPERTEILLQVEMSDEEAALYTALRRRALEALGQAGGPPGRRSLRILAEIMRLRRACCNARLVLPESKIASSKLALFSNLAFDLLENGHKALVFSQFVDHLSIIREHLDQQGIRYCYLDGATPTRERREQIRQFQEGKHSLFLISLKAGGLGLNLTAADYVVHMDPWWNPAVEDQASDRAHRIGQHRPVTIYRLVTRNTIEEKIVRLHHDKRELADNLLAGTDKARGLNPAELLQLIRDE
ncbi:MAG: DEAD/DEAH box helicase [Thermodesulfobacteriota bacterium]